MHVSSQHRLCRVVHCEASRRWLAVSRRLFTSQGVVSDVAALMRVRLMRWEEANTWTDITYSPRRVKREGVARLGSPSPEGPTVMATG
ncbi:hypothetical protein MTO96_031815 [Rhipicephalus appendiculatus]